MTVDGFSAIFYLEKIGMKAREIRGKRWRVMLSAMMMMIMMEKALHILCVGSGSQLFVASILMAALIKAVSTWPIALVRRHRGKARNKCQLPDVCVEVNRIAEQYGTSV